MRYPADLLDEIRSRMPVSRVVERHVKLKRAGREYIGLSPFKTERTPSFTVNDHKGFYHCFASGEHGDVFTFLMKVEGLSFPEAVERLASQTGVVLPAPKPVDEVKDNHEVRLREALESACQFFEASLASREGNAARAYLEKRGVQLSETKAFRLGYAPDSKTSLKQHLAGKGFSLAEMQDAGLLIHGEDIAVPYDRFRGRLIFPITDTKRRVIAFGGRALLPDQQPKYLNSPETELFHKGHVLFNLASAREAAKTKKEVIVAEGYMDVIALARAGFANAVAPLGTALTADQLRLIWAMTSLPTLCFDGDAAGQKAAHRAIDTALPFLEPGRSLQFAFLPEGRDPDDMVSGGATDALVKLLAAPAPLIDVLWARERDRHPLDTPEQRAALDARLMEMTQLIEHKSLRFHYVSALRERLRGKGYTAPQARRGDGSSWRSRTSTPVGGRGARPAPRADFGNRNAARTSSLLASTIAQASAPSSAPGEALVIMTILQYPWLLDEHVEEIAGLHLDDADCFRVRNTLLTIHQTEEALDNEKLLEHLSGQGYGAELERLGRICAHKAAPHFASGADKQHVLDWWRRVMMLHGAARSLAEAESDYINEQTDESWPRLHEVKRQAEITSS
jgi:DNA primase